MRELGQYLKTKTFKNVARKNKYTAGKQESAWFGLRIKPDIPSHYTFYQRLHSAGIELLTTEQEYIDGSDEFGVHFCPTVKTPQGRSSAKSIDVLMSEGR